MPICLPSGGKSLSPPTLCERRPRRLAGRLGCAAKKAGGLHKLWRCAGSREAARSEHGINLPGHLLCDDHRRHRFHCSESGAARPPRVTFHQSPPSRLYLVLILAIPIRPTHFANSSRTPPSPPRTSARSRALRGNYLTITASLWSGCPQTIFSGQISSSCDWKTSRPVLAINQTATPPAISGSKNG
jgi:hypothetical protein